MAISIYPLSRALYLNNRSKLIIDDAFTGFNREAQVLFLLCIILFTRLKRTSTWDEYISFSFSFIHCAIIILFMLIEFRYAAWYALIAFILWVTVKQPKYSGKSKIVRLRTEQDFVDFINPKGEEMKKQNANSKDSKKKNFSEAYSTLVVFQAAWNDNCTYTYPLWADFSNRFTTERMRFGEIDVMQNEKVAKENKVNLSGLAGQLPALILYQDGKEVLRFPPINVSEGNYAKVNKYKSKELIKYFDLDKRYIATRGESAPNSQTKGPK